MNLRQIEVFRAVMASSSTIGAAAVLRVSQSAISRQLAQLEAELGFHLFERQKGRLVARPEAHALLAQAEQLTLIVSRVGRFAEELKAGAVGHGLLKIAVPHSLATTVLPRLVKEFLRERPSASIEIMSGPSGALEQFVTSRTADLALTRLPPENTDFAQRMLLRSNAVCVMPCGHPLAALQVVRAVDLAGHELVLLGRQRPIRQEIDAVFRKRGLAPICRVEAHSVASACALVAEGLGVSVVTGFMAAQFLRPAIELRPFDPKLPSHYGIITRRDATLSIMAEQFVAALRHGLAGAGDALADMSYRTG